MDDIAPGFGVMVSVVVLIVGLLMEKWFWWLPAAKRLRNVASVSESMVFDVAASHSPLRDFMYSQPRLLPRLKVIDRKEMAEDQIAEIVVDFIKFSIVWALVVFVLVVRGSEHSTAAHPALASTVVVAATELSGITDASAKSLSGAPGSSEYGGKQPAAKAKYWENAKVFIRDNWWAPVIETGVLFIGLYASVRILREFKKLEKDLA